MKPKLKRLIIFDNKIKKTLDYGKQLCYIIKALRNAGVAQLVEQLICNQQVRGSSPFTSSISVKGSLTNRVS